MLIQLANHNDDIRRLLEKGYALRFDSAYLVVRDIPYLDDKGALQIGAIVTKLIFIDKVRVQQENHVVFFAGSVPYELSGLPIANLGGSLSSLTLDKTDVVVERTFSNKPDAGFPDFFEKIEHYVRVISGPAMARYDVTPLTFRADNDVVSNSVFKFHDTLTSRAEIGDLVERFREEVIAIIGLGGTGAFVLDFIVKTPVREVRGFDHDAYHVHNAYRSPGKLDEPELGKTKSEVYQQRYENFRTSLHLQRKYIDRSSADDLKGVTFVFVCVDKGSARAEIFELLIDMGIPFIDVGMGLDRSTGRLSGTLRATYYATSNAAEIRDMQLAETSDDPDDVYRANIQIGELNALNACLAVVRYKQIRGFYLDDNRAYHLLMRLDTLRTFSEAA